VRIDPRDKIGGVSVMEVRRLLRGFMGATVVGAYFRDAGLLETLLERVGWNGLP